MRKQVLGHFDHDLTADDDLAFHQGIHGRIDRALDAVFHGDDPEMGFVPLRGAEHIAHMPDRQEVDLGAKLSQCRLVAERPLRPQIGHPDTLLQGASGGNDFAKHVGNACGGKGARVLLDQLGNEVALPAGHVDWAVRSRGLDPAYLTDK